MLAAISFERVPGGVSEGCDGSAAGDGQVSIMPATAIPGKLVDVLVDAPEYDLLGAGKHKSSGCAIRAGCARCCGQVIVMPAVAVPPQLMDMVVGAYVIHVLSTLGGEHVSSRVSVSPSSTTFVSANRTTTMSTGGLISTSMAQRTI